MKLERLEKDRSPFKTTSASTNKHLGIYSSQVEFEVSTSVKFALFKDMIGANRALLERCGLMACGEDTTLQVFHPDIATEVVTAARQREEGHEYDECVATGDYKFTDGDQFGKAPQGGIELKYPMSGPDLNRLETEIRGLIEQCLAEARRAELDQALTDKVIKEAEQAAYSVPPPIPTSQPTFSDLGNNPVLRGGNCLVLRSVA